MHASESTKIRALGSNMTKLLAIPALN